MQLRSSYAVLKSLLKASYASASDLLGSIAAFEQKPEVQGGVKPWQRSYVMPALSMTGIW